MFTLFLMFVTFVVGAWFALGFEEYIFDVEMDQKYPEDGGVTSSFGHYATIPWIVVVTAARVLWTAVRG